MNCGSEGAGAVGLAATDAPAAELDGLVAVVAELDPVALDAAVRHPVGDGVGRDLADRDAGGVRVGERPVEDARYRGAALARSGVRRAISHPDLAVSVSDDVARCHDSAPTASSTAGSLAPGSWQALSPCAETATRSTSRPVSVRSCTPNSTSSRVPAQRRVRRAGEAGAADDEPLPRRELDAVRHDERAGVGAQPTLGGAAPQGPSADLDRRRAVVEQLDELVLRTARAGRRRAPRSRRMPRRAARRDSRWLRRESTARPRSRAPGRRWRRRAASSRCARSRARSAGCRPAACTRSGPATARSGRRPPHPRARRRVPRGTARTRSSP